MITAYDRETKEYVKLSEPATEKLKFLYQTPLGRILLKMIFARRWYSKLTGLYYSSRFSKRKIHSFAKENGINIENDYRSFNDFFTRKRTDDFPELRPGELPAVADSKLLAVPINDVISVKGTDYTAEELLGTDIHIDDFKDGWCLVFRLGLDDYHRYIYPSDGRIQYDTLIKGTLHTVRPIASKYRVFYRNTRNVELFDTDEFGAMAMIEVGAMLVGKIHNHKAVGSFKKSEEKGYFEYGGSTIILMTNSDIKIDQDIMDQSEKGIETIVRAGEKIGENHVCMA